MHLVTTPLAAMGGHTDIAAQRSSILWLFLLAAAVGATAWQFSRDRLVAAAAATGTLLLPALHAVATRYYYDLPFTAALWALVAAALATWDRRPIVGGASRELHLRIRQGGLSVAALGSGTLLVAYLALQGPESSLRVMLDEMWGDLGQVGFEAGFSGGSLGGAIAAFSPRPRRPRRRARLGHAGRSRTPRNQPLRFMVSPSGTTS